jgi:hypothetical protein
VQDLEAHANKIPAMSNFITKETIRYYVSKIKNDRAIVEVGVWLGACTAYIALGLKDSHKDNTIYVYDRFVANDSEVSKAEWNGIVLYEGENTKSIFQAFLAPYCANIKLSKCNIFKAKYKGPKIGVFIDDVSKREKYFEHTIKTFKKYFIPGETICFFMDYFFFEKTGLKIHRYQYDWMQAHKKEFQFIKHVEDSCCGIFLYKGKR